MKLDIACGTNKKRGFVGVDIWKGADIVFDLEKYPWPFDDNSVDEVYCSHYIEHVPDLVAFANELHRIMKCGAKAEITAPYYSSIRAWQDPTHVRAISERTFWYFNSEYRMKLGIDHYPIAADFDFECCFDIDPQWKNKSEEDLQFAMTHYFNVVNNIRAILTKRKPFNVNAVMLVQQAVKCWERGYRNKAYKLSIECLDIEPQYDALLIAGEYELSHNKYEAAEKRFRGAVRLDKHSYEAHAGIVRAYISSGKLISAQKHIDMLNKKSLDLGPLLQMYL